MTSRHRAPQPETDIRLNPEIYTGYREGLAEEQFAEAVVVAANEHAAKAGTQILKAGGNAADATVAVQLVLGLVEPQSSGPLGGLYLTYWDQQTKQVFALDGRETAPAAVTPELLAGVKDLRSSVISVGVPGAVAALHEFHSRFGKLSWEQCVAPAADLAEHGFQVSPRLAASLAAFAPVLAQELGARTAWMLKGETLKAGEWCFNLAYGRAMRSLQKDPRSIYTGELAQKILHRIQQTGGVLTAADLAGYQPRWVEPISMTYRGLRVYGPAGSTAGAATVFAALQILQQKGLPDQLNGEALHRMIEAERLAYADRDTWLGDPQYHPWPGDLLWRDDYAGYRAGSITAHRAEQVRAGFGRQLSSVPAADHGTSHFCIRDSHGNVVSVTTSVEAGFGCFAVAEGMVLNNTLCDFDVDQPGTVNAPAGGKRPRSSMAPLLLAGETGPVLGAMGSPGGFLIIQYLIKTIVAWRDYGFDLQQACNLANIGVLREHAWVSADGDLPHREQVLAQLTQKGHEVLDKNIASGVAVVFQDETGQLHTAVDPRREGVAVGW